MEVGAGPLMDPFFQHIPCMIPCVALSRNCSWIEAVVHSAPPDAIKPARPSSIPNESGNPPDVDAVGAGMS
ncbi:hypothetical protein N7454_009931 [Penicillium verhagenii]|nr:hypothetical protein N7454_009931 [Penicillium verhagenii]